MLSVEMIRAMRFMGLRLRPFSNVSAKRGVVGLIKSIKEWPKSERPRERLLSQGAGALSVAEFWRSKLTASGGSRRISLNGGLHLKRENVSDLVEESVRYE